MNTTIHTTAQQILEVIGTEKMSTQVVVCAVLLVLFQLLKALFFRLIVRFDLVSG